MDELLQRACAYLGEDVADVVNHRVEGDFYVLVICHGIKGSPKFRVPLVELVPDSEPDATDAARDLAAEHSLDLSYVIGTGAAGRILVRDVRACIEEG